ncbi:MAG TPA: hypothetical protein DEP91_03085 [Sphingomonas bacterium]|jgi:hypothetical protein|uniref:Uncharacterized protein n=1 Tax=Sphingomonas bacterium TaxID=1895847 RepID=A0A3D0W8S6_9SPHN|nr:hypothetical protein [Sphingomonas bacterium]
MFQAQPHVDHQRPTHDQFCRCRTCKPAHPDDVAPLRVWLAISIMLCLFWAGFFYAAFGR